MPEPRRFYLLLATLFLIGCSEVSDYGRQNERNIEADTLLGMSQSIEPEIEILEGGKLRTRATAPRGVIKESQGVNKTELYGPPVQVAVFDTLGRVETRIECNEAFYEASNLRFEFFGDVHVLTGAEGSRSLRTERLVWNEETQEFSSNGFVIITTPADSITGYGFTGTQDLSSYRLGTVTGEFSVD